MPREFVSEHWDEGISNPVSLLLPTGARWKVSWEKRGHDVMMFGEKWEEFARFYYLDVDHYLRFSFKGGSFGVEIYDHNGMEEMYYPSTEKTPEYSNEEEDEESDKGLSSSRKKLKINRKE